MDTAIGGARRVSDAAAGEAARGPPRRAKIEGKLPACLVIKSVRVLWSRFERFAVLDPHLPSRLPTTSLEEKYFSHTLSYCNGPRVRIKVVKRFLTLVIRYIRAEPYIRTAFTLEGVCVASVSWSVARPAHPSHPIVIFTPS